MVTIDALEEPSWLLGPSPPVSACYSGLVFHQSADARLMFCISEVKFAFVAALRFHHRALYGMEENFDLDSRLMAQDSFLTYIASALVADFEDPGLLNVLQETQFDAATSNIAFER